MSKTKRDKIRGRYRKQDKAYDDITEKLIKALKENGHSFTSAWTLIRNMIKSPYHRLTEEEKLILGLHYSKNPSWWNNLFNRRPKRREDRDKLKKIDLKSPDNDAIIFTDDDKPDSYYW